MNKRKVVKPKGKKKKTVRKIRYPRIIIIALLIFSIIAGAGNIYFKLASRAVDPSNTKSVIVDIPNGSSAKKIAEILKAKNLIKNKRVFVSNVKNTEKSSQMKAGKYKFSQSMNNEEIINKMIDGMIYQEGTKITIPEGSISTDIVNMLVKNKLGSREKYVKLFRNPKELSETFPFLKDTRIKTLEGFLYPATYHFTKEESEKDIFVKMIKEFEKNYNKQVKPLAEKKNLNFYDVVIMASIIEKETVKDEDRALVSGVFYNRLDKKMRLQSDAVLQYGLPERKSRVRYKDLKVDTVYNLYLHDGLPPTPIVSPGIKSLIAAAAPKESKYLYFITGTDNKNYYSETYEEHMVYAKKYHKELDALEAQEKANKTDSTEKSDTVDDVKDNN